MHANHAIVCTHNAGIRNAFTCNYMYSSDNKHVLAVPCWAGEALVYTCSDVCGSRREHRKSFDGTRTVPG